MAILRFEKTSSMSEQNSTRVQLPNEPADFILALHCLVEHCNFRALKEEMIRDRLVVGLADVALSERLQMDPDLTLQRAVEKARNSELVKKQQGTIRNADKNIHIEAVGEKRKIRYHKKESQQGCSWHGLLNSRIWTGNERALTNVAVQQ